VSVSTKPYFSYKRAAGAFPRSTERTTRARPWLRDHWMMRSTSSRATPLPCRSGASHHPVENAIPLIDDVFNRFEKRVGIARDRAQSDVAQALPVVGLNAADHAVSLARLSTSPRQRPTAGYRRPPTESRLLGGIPERWPRRGSCVRLQRPSRLRCLWR
jgi:hypothetical protein